MSDNTPQAPQQAANKSWFARHKIISAVLAVVAIIVVVNAVNGGGSSSGNGGGSGTTAAGAAAGADEAAPAKPTVSVKAEKMIREFKDNEAAADLRYKDKVVKVTGVVTKVDTEMLDESKYVIDINDGGDWSILTVSCNDVPQSVAASVKKGSTVSVVGTFDDGGDLGVDIKDCTLAS